MFGLGGSKKDEVAAASTAAAPSAEASSTKLEPGFQTAMGCVALVTGSTGLCGARLVEMLLERGAKQVIAMDVTPPTKVLSERFKAVQAKTKGKIIFKSGRADGDITSVKAVEAAFSCVDQVDVVFHIAALVGPFHAREMYLKVNYEGTVNIINACKKFKVPKLVNSSSPSTRFTGGDVAGQREDELYIPNTFVELYAETKAMGEKAVTEACSDELLTISVAPHQVYGPYDTLFFPKLMETCGNRRLRIFGAGKNIISVCYVDNYAHGCMCGADALYKDSPALGKFYIVTDSNPQLLWEMINTAGTTLGFEDLYSKMHLPVWLLYTIAYICKAITLVTGKKMKLTPFTVKMMVIHRYFSIDNARKDLHYGPLVEFDEGWPKTIEWFRVNWLPGYLEANPVAAEYVAAHSSKKND